MNKISILISVLLFPSAYLFGQVMGPPPEPPVNREIGRQLEQIKIWQMTKDMDLPTNKAEKFFPLYNSYDSHLRTISADRRRSVQVLDSMLMSNADDASLKKQTHDILSFDAELSQEHEKFMQSMADVLSPVEVAKYIVFEQKFDREIRQRIRMIMQQRMRNGDRY